MEMDERLKFYKSEIEREERFGFFYRLLTEYNEKYNLTAITEEKEVFYKHFLDSAAGEFLFPQGARVLEVGSGAGFPSLVLKILREDLSFTLVESVGKKSDFLRVAVQNLGMGGMNVLNGRAENFAREEIYREKYDVVCARAVARMNTLAEYCMPFIKKGGIFIAYKSGDGEELEECKNAVYLLGGRIRENIVYELPEGYGKRSLVVCEKERKTPLLYPRGNGKERKKPL